jgi:hypothetical protein
MCGPVQQLSIQPKKAKSISEFKEICDSCPCWDYSKDEHSEDTD